MNRRPLVCALLLAACHRGPGSEGRTEAAPTVSAPRIEPTPAGERAPAPSPDAIHYRVTDSPGPDGNPLVGLVAERGAATFVVIPPRAGGCLAVILERDLDGDGLLDALVENAMSCGGNLLPSSFSYVAGTLGPRFEEQALAEAWSAPKLETWQGRPSFAFVTINEGSNLDRPQETTRRFVFERGKVVLAEEHHAVELMALANLRSEQFDSQNPDAERTLAFDLDGDGKADRIVGRLWERWGRFYWSVEFSDGRTSKDSELAYKRIGVLADETNGHHDLVCDFDTRFRWNGESYVEVK